MKKTLTPLLAALIGCGALTGHAGAQSMPELKFSGFGTVSAVHSSEQNADFVGSVFQPSGAGHTSSWSLAPDSKLGGQASAVFNNKVSAVVQLVAKQQYDNSWVPQVEWANVKFQATPELSLRLGRVAAPSYLLSESRFVGYSNPWVRPPTEVYGVLSITSNDGIDATYRSQIAGANNSVQAFYGTSNVKLPSNGKVKSNPSWGINDSVEIGSLTLRAGYNQFKLDLEIPSLDGLFTGLSQFAAGAGAVPVPSFQTAAAQALAMKEKYKLNGMALSAVALGASYDPGSWFVMSEFVALKGAGFLSDSDSWYATAGYRFGSFTPYLTYSTTKAKVVVDAGISATGSAALDAGGAGLSGGVNASLYAFTPTQKTSSIGLRWDVMSNVALKAQYDHLTVGAQSNGKLRVFPGLTAGRSANVVSVAADFVF
jgi:hypothetical protein